MATTKRKKKEKHEKKEKKEKHEKHEKKEKAIKFKHIGIATEDEFWEALQAPLDTIHELNENLEKANEEILRLNEEAELIAENMEKDHKHVMRFLKVQMKKKEGRDMSVEVSEGYIVLTYKEKPEGILGKVLEAIIKLVEAIRHIVEEVPELIKQVEELAENVEDMPDKIQESVTSGAITNPIEIAKAVKNTAINVKLAAGAPKEIRELVEHVRELAKTLKEVADEIAD